jgi:neutral ceramidase
MNIFDDVFKKPRGVINWFSVHPTSMNNSNHLISGDNKGLASLMFEKSMNQGKMPGRGPFVAAFASSNLGDISPNINGPYCMNSREKCSNIQSVCDDASMCIASGPGKDMFESTYLIAKRQFNKAKQLLNSPIKLQTKIEGKFFSAFQWIDMTRQQVKLNNGTIAKTCMPALGYSFAAGTTDGPGMSWFTQGTRRSSRMWSFVGDLLKRPSEEQTQCHAPKPILLNTGEMSFPYKWHPDVVSTQLLKLGQLVIAGVPGELTTMAGRRLRDTISKVMPNTKVVIAGLSNSYTHYVTTFEEYQEQRYEAGSTIYGPHTLLAYQKQYERLAEMSLKEEVDIENISKAPSDLYHVANKYSLQFLSHVLYDGKPFGYEFGDCLVQPPLVAYRGVDTVVVEFVSSHLRNNFQTEKSFLYIEKLRDDNERRKWKIIAVDTDWETTLEWSRTSYLFSQSKVQISWEIPKNTKPGIYRIRHVGVYKSFLGGMMQKYKGYTKNFKVK